MNDIIGDDNPSAPTDLHIECKNIAKTNMSSTVGKGIGNRRQGAVHPSKRNFAQIPKEGEANTIEDQDQAAGGGNK